MKKSAIKFTDFVKKTVILKSGKVASILHEGIDHFEALPIVDFLHAVKNLSKFIVTEKLDGANLTTGFDNNGDFYTSREAKGNATKFYSVEDWDVSSATNGFRSAHAALEQVSGDLRKILNRGEAVEVEVLFGRQPNAIVYGSSYIAFLRMVEGENGKEPNQNKIKQLAVAFENKIVTVSTPHVVTEDGVSLETKDIEHTWKFTTTAFIDANKFETIDVAAEVSGLEDFLNGKNKKLAVLNLTNGEVLLADLKSIPKQYKEVFKEERETLSEYVTTTFKLPIKEKILDAVVRKLEPKLRDVEIESHEDTGIEGLVFLDPRTKKQFKIVDKDVFTAINNFNFGIRENIKSTRPGTRESYGASLGLQGDVFGNMVKRLADIIGIPQLGRYVGIKQALKKYVGPNLGTTVRNFTKDFKSKNVPGLKKEIINTLQEGLVNLGTALDQYNKNWKNYALKLKSGREIRYSNEIHNRTLSTFAETRRELQSILKSVQDAKTVEDLAIALYGKQLKSLH